MAERMEFGFSTLKVRIAGKVRSLASS